MIKIKGQKIDHEEYIEKWTQWGLSTKVRSEEELKESINWLYQKCDLDKPKNIIICRGHEEFVDSVRDSVGSSVWDSVRHSVKDSVGDSVGDSVRDSVRDSVWDSVKDSVWDSVKDSVKDSVWDSVWDYNSPQYLADYLAFADVFVDTGVLSDEKAKELGQFKKHSEGVCMTAFGKETAVVLVSPKWNLNNDNQLHSEDDYAIKWSEDSGFYFLYGVRFEKDLWQKVTQNKMDFEDIMAIENIDQRMAAMKILDTDELLDGADAEMKDEYSCEQNDTEVTYQLYLIKGIFDKPEYFLRYNCPSTDRVYLSGIEPSVGKKESAKEARAWKFGLEVDELAYIEEET